jgi:anti-sigma regulatory factor (Ser/Thr protein kinase)
MESPALRLVLPACVESLEGFRRFIRGGADACGIAPGEIDKLDLVMEEILVNVARYAYGPDTGTTEVTYWQTSPGRLRVEISDQGRPFNPLAAGPPDLSRGLADRPIGGLGVFLARNLVGSMAYRREDGRNVLSFEFPGHG